MQKTTKKLRKIANDLLLVLIFLLGLIIWLYNMIKTAWGALEAKIAILKARLYHHYDGYRYYVWRDETGRLYIRNTQEIAANNRSKPKAQRLSIEKILEHKIYMTK